MSHVVYKDRKNTNSRKWDECKEKFGKENILPLWIADMDFEAYNLFAQVTIQDDKIIKIDNVYGDGGSGNDSYINKAVNGTSSKTGVVKQITEKGNLDGIDTVSRATCTSQAIIDACQQALNNAKRQ